MRTKAIRLIFIFTIPVVAATLAALNLAAQQSTTSLVVIRVTDPTNAVVPHAQVRVVPAPDPAPKMETDDRGELALALKPSGYALFVRSQGFATFSTHFDVRETKDPQTVAAVLSLAPTGSPVVLPTSAKDSLTLLASPYHIPMGISAADLKAMPHITLTMHNPHTNAGETYSGVRLADLLSKMNASLGSELHGEPLASYIVATGSDGYEAVLALAEVDPTFHPGEVIVADTMNRQPLDAHNGPFKLVVSEDKRPARAVRNLTTIELKSTR
jgi:hypothetical protein